MEHSRTDESRDVDVLESDGTLDPPGKYAVLLLNDDFTTMEFVIEVLQKFFHHSTEEAMAIMLKVHHEGRGVAGIYPFEIAETKVEQVQTHARVKGHPLKCIMEKI